MLSDDLGDLPFECTFTQNSILALRYDEHHTLTGYCDGNVIGKTGPLFFRLGSDEYTISHVLNEYDVLSKLQHYDFVPRIVELKRIGEYTVLFTELLSVVDLTEDYKVAIVKGIYLLHKLYSEVGFTHGDAHIGNMIITSDYKLYIIDFEYSHIPDNFNDRRSWKQDFYTFLDSLEEFYDLDDDKFKELGLLTESALKDPDVYLEYIKRVTALL